MQADKTLSALLVGEYKDDRHMVRRLFQKLDWQLFEAGSRREALECLDCHPVHVLVLETGLPGWNWKTVLNELYERASPPQLVVACRQADESLWSEVLNEGGYDVMTQPLDAYEVERVIASARRHIGYRTAADGA